MTDNRPASWQEDVQSWLTVAASQTDDIFDAGLRKLRKRFGFVGVPKIQPYMGYASNDAIHLHGRVLTNPPVDPDYHNDQWWENLSRAVQRFASDEVPGVTVEARLGTACETTISDREGYFHVKLPRDRVRLPYWSTANLRILAPSLPDQTEDTVTCRVASAPADASYGIISDVDDTVVHTGATDILTMAKLTFFGNARTRAPLDGVAKLYELMHFDGRVDGVSQNPLFYVSSSPWNLYDLLEDFLELNAIPAGPLLLRDLGFDEDKFLKTGHEHKLVKARRLMRTFSELPFVLFGDSGQEDARLYMEAALEFPSRIKAIFIRDITPDTDDHRDEFVEQSIQACAAVGVPMYRVRDSAEVARHAIDLGLLPASTLPIVQAAVRKDRTRKEGAL